MLALTALPGTDLTDYVLQLLTKHGIETVQDFIASDVDNVCKVTNLSRSSCANIKSELLNKYGPKQSQMSQLYKQIMREPSTVYRTGIPDLDAILTADVFSAGCLLEICGSPAIGKTQLCLTIAINFATNYAEALYIGTRVKCVGTRVYQMLKSRNVDKCEMGRIMQRIKIEQTHSAEGIVNILNELLKQLESDERSTLTNIKLVVIDSLPAVWMQLLSQEHKRRANFLLTRLANLMRKLAKKHFLVFVYVNLMVRIEQERSCFAADLLSANEEYLQANVNDDNHGSGNDEDDDVASQLSESDSNPIQLRPALGTYWSSVPSIRLLIESSNTTNCDDDDDDATIRVIRVLKSCYSKSGDSAIVRITDAGVV